MKVAALVATALLAFAAVVCAESSFQHPFHLKHQRVVLSDESHPSYISWLNGDSDGLSPYEQHVSDNSSIRQMEYESLKASSDRKRQVVEFMSMGRSQSAPVRPEFVAEIDAMKGTLIRFPLGVPVSFVSDLTTHVQVYMLVSNFWRAFAEKVMREGGAVMENIQWIIVETDSYWTRDYGPWFVRELGEASFPKYSIVDFTYNRARPKDDLVAETLSRVFNTSYFFSDLVHAGGNMMGDGRGGAASSELVFEENAHNKSKVIHTMRTYWGIDSYRVITDPTATYIKHIDCWAKFLTPNIVLVNRVPRTDPNWALTESAARAFTAAPSARGRTSIVGRIPYDDGRNYTVVRVDTPEHQPYTNSYIVNKFVYVPIMKDPPTQWDSMALKAYSDALPGYTVKGVLSPAWTPWRSTDALHCRTNSIPRGLGDV
ncbi:hypothetical protein BJ742DRAFT_778783 [Cladochytrium replicatum]|nr:hypothetical protein BJ742DRAFT_778783 [Cladochytrium replicatum]